MSITFTQALARCIDHREIFHDEMVVLMRQIMQGEVPPTMVAALAMGLRVKKETVGEIAAAAQVMREFVIPVRIAHAEQAHLVDIVGTGGDGAASFNVSTRPQCLPSQVLGDAWPNTAAAASVRRQAALTF